MEPSFHATRTVNRLHYTIHINRLRDINIIASMKCGNKLTLNLSIVRNSFNVVFGTLLFTEFTKEKREISLFGALFILSKSIRASRFSQIEKWLIDTEVFEDSKTNLQKHLLIFFSVSPEFEF